MALNVRYVFPSLPAVYFSVGVAWQICITRPRVVRWSIILLITMSGIESIIVCPFYFSYVNPAVGGMYRMPPALHASNFDGGQIWRLERWVSDQAKQGDRGIWTCLHGTVPEEAIRFSVGVPDKQLLRDLLLSHATRPTPKSPRADTGDALVVMRGLCVPAPWNRVTGEIVDDEYMNLLEQLVVIEPDLYLSPTLAVFYVEREHRRVP